MTLAVMTGRFSRLSTENNKFMRPTLFRIKKYVVPAQRERAVLFLFPAGFTYLWQYRMLIRRLNKMGISVVGFDFAWRTAIRDLSIEKLIAYMQEVAKKVNKEIAQAPHNRYAVCGSSFGSVPALFCAKQQPEISHVILNVPYGRLSNLIWSYKPLKHVKSQLLQQGITSPLQLHELTLPIETKNNIELLDGRTIVCMSAKRDTIVRDSHEIQDVLKMLHGKVRFIESPFGHFWGGIHNGIRTSQWADSLRK